MTNTLLVFYTPGTMEEDNKTVVEQSNQTESQPASTPEVGFPTPQGRSKKSSGKWIFLVLGLVLLIGGIVFLVSRNNKIGSGEATPGPAVQEELSTPPAVEESQTPTPSPVAKEEVTIQIQNGTGITGEASYLQGILKSLGYSDIKAGNAVTQDATTTTITFKSTLSQAVVDEITTKLKGIYEKVETKTSSSTTYDVVIVTGLRKGATAKPVATASSSPTSTASPSSTPAQ